MIMIPIVIGIPVLLAVLMLFLRDRVRGPVVYVGAGCVMAATVIFIVNWVMGGAVPAGAFTSTETVDHLMMLGEAFLMCFIVYVSIKHRKPLPALLSVAQTLLLFYTEFTVELPGKEHMMVDSLRFHLHLYGGIYERLPCPS